MSEGLLHLADFLGHFLLCKPSLLKLLFLFVLVLLESLVFCLDARKLAVIGLARLLQIQYATSVYFVLVVLDLVEEFGPHQLLLYKLEVVHLHLLCITLFGTTTSGALLPQVMVICDATLSIKHHLMLKLLLVLTLLS